MTCSSGECLRILLARGFRVFHQVIALFVSAKSIRLLLLADWQTIRNHNIHHSALRKSGGREIRKRCSMKFAQVTAALNQYHYDFMLRKQPESAEHICSILIHSALFCTFCSARSEQIWIPDCSLAVAPEFSFFCGRNGREVLKSKWCAIEEVHFHLLHGPGQTYFSDIFAPYCSATLIALIAPAVFKFKRTKCASDTACSSTGIAGLGQIILSLPHCPGRG